MTSPALKQNVWTDEVRVALQRVSKLVVAEVHRPAYEFQTVHWGWRCRACGAEAEGKWATVEHKRDCPLAILGRAAASK